MIHSIPAYHRKIKGMFVCLFVCLVGWLVFSVPLENFFTHLETTPLPLQRATIFYLYSALIAIEQWGFFNMQHLLWPGSTLYNGHLWGPVTLIPNAERLAVELSLPVLTTSVSPMFEPWSPSCEANALQLLHPGGVDRIKTCRALLIWLDITFQF